MSKSAIMTELPSTAGGYWILRTRDIVRISDDMVDMSGAIPSGKWMLFYDKSLMDAQWIKACEHFDSGRFGENIRAMKVSTFKDNDRSSNPQGGVIIIYTPTAHKDDVMRWGSYIQEAMDYGPAMYFKTEAQTLAGTLATGQHGNHTLSLPRRIHWPYMSASENRR